MSKNYIAIPFLLLFLAIGGQVKGQGATDVLRYSLQYPSYDPVSIVMPGVSSATGFGAYQENPASMALFEEGFFSFGLSNRYVQEESSYLGTGTEFDDTQTNIGDIGLVYKVPTQRGRLVVGGGYSQTTDFNRALSVNARNNQSTITDFYNITADDSLFFAAFDAYAIDFATTDSSFSETASIFRIGFAQYPGINQFMELTERGVMGEYSAFIATEFQQNIMVGVSLGLVNGSYNYDREFLESDEQNDYNFQFIDTDGDGVGETDIDNILSTDTIDADFTAFTARLGFLYQVNPNINIGASYQYNGKLNIDEVYNTLITSTFDNGVVFEDDAPGNFSYKIKRPDRFNFGITFKDMNGLNVSLSAENVRYSQARIEFEDIRLGNDEEAINETVESNFKDVFNLRAGLEFALNPYFTPRVGYAYYPSPQEETNSERQFISGGFSARVFDNVSFDVGAQYSFWEDRNQLYRYFDGNNVVGEVAGEDVTRWNIMAGVKIAL
jgi:opacity protein-like surface antigen